MNCIVNARIYACLCANAYIKQRVKFAFLPMLSHITAPRGSINTKSGADAHTVHTYLSLQCENWMLSTLSCMRRGGRDKTPSFPLLILQIMTVLLCANNKSCLQQSLTPQQFQATTIFSRSFRHISLSSSVDSVLLVVVENDDQFLYDNNSLQDN